MVIYIDVLVFLNTLINCLLLLGAGALRRIRLGKIRLLFSSLFGGFFSLMLLLPDMGKLFSVLIKAFGAVIMTLIAFGFENARAFLRSLGSVLFVSFSFAGVMFAVYLVFRPEKMTLNNGAVYFDISVRAFVICAVVCYLFIKLFVFLLKRYSSDNTLCTVSIEMNSKTVVLKGLADSGNSLTDVFTNKPVTTVEKSAVKRITENANENRFGVVPVKTALGTGILKTVRADKMTVYYDGKKYEIASPVIALSDESLSDGEYGALINPMIFEFGSKKDETVKNNK